MNCPILGKHLRADHLAPFNSTALTALPAMFQIFTYRGVAAGWQTVVSPAQPWLIRSINPARSAADSARLLTLLNRVRPDFSNRQTATN